MLPVVATTKRNDITIEQKKELKQYYEENNTFTHSTIAAHFSNQWNMRLVRSTVSGILRSELADGRSAGAKRKKSVEYPHLEESLYLYFSNIRAHNIPISDEILIAQAKIFGSMFGISDLEFKYSRGWLSNFKIRHGIKEHTLVGERGSVNIVDVKKGRCDLQSLTSKYDLDCIYNFDETALYYRLPPNKTLANCSVSGSKESKERLTVGVCCNASGKDKVKLVVISKFARPRCFGKVFDPNNVVHYYNNQKAWMTAAIFEDWLIKFNHKMKNDNKKVLLLVDNAASQNTELQLSHVSLHYLPPNTTSFLQPCDAGIIRSFRCYYKNKLVLKMIENIQNKKELYNPDVKEAIFLVRESWNCVSEVTIHNCWLHTNILGEKSVAIPCENQNKECQELSANISKFHKSSFNLDRFAFNAEEYIKLDSAIPTGEILTNEDIFEIVSLNKENENDPLDSNNIEPRIVSSIDAIAATELLLDYFINNNMDFSKLTEIKKQIENVSFKKLVQKKLFF